MFMVLIPVIIPFFTSIGLSMSEIFLLQAIFGMVVATCEVPSGYICDLWGRKKTLLVGSFLIGCGHTYLLWSDSFSDLLVFEIFVAVGLSLVSGADISMMYDLLHESGNKDREVFSKTTANLQFFKTVGEASASIIGGLLALWSLRHVVVVEAFMGWALFVSACFLVEPTYEKMPKKEHKANIKKILKHLFQSDRLLLLIFMNLVLWGLGSFIAVWMYQKHWALAEIPIGYFGVLWAAYNLTVGVTGKLTPFIEKKLGITATLCVMGLLPIMGYFGFGFWVTWVGVVFGFLINMSRGITQVILKEALNWKTPSAFRATINSLVSLCFRGSFAVIGPIVGLAIDRYGLSAAFYGVGSMFILGFVVLLIPLILQFQKTQYSR